MICILQIALVVFGLWAVRATALRVNGLVVGRPHTIYIGMILIVQGPIALLSGAAIAGAEGLNAIKTGGVVDARRLQKKYGWLDPAITGSAAALAAAIGLSAVRREEPEYTPPDKVAGVRNLVAEERDRAAAERDETEEWRGAPDPSAADHRRRRG